LPELILTNIDQGMPGLFDYEHWCTMTLVLLWISLTCLHDVFFQLIIEMSTRGDSHAYY
jgi:hypothetical protein